MSVGVAPLLREGCAEADTLEDPLGDGVLLELLVETAERDDVDHRDGVAADERDVVPSAGEELGEKDTDGHELPERESGSEGALEIDPLGVRELLEERLMVEKALSDAKLAVADTLGDTLVRASVDDAQAEYEPVCEIVAVGELDKHKVTESVLGRAETVTLVAALALTLWDPLVLVVRVSVRVAEGESDSESVSVGVPLRVTSALLDVGLPLGEREELAQFDDECEVDDDRDGDGDGKLEREGHAERLAVAEVAELRERDTDGEIEGVAGGEREALPPVALIVAH